MPKGEQEKWKTMNTQKRKLAFSLFLMLISVLALAPALTFADKPQQNGTFTINATGQAIPIGGKKGSSSSSASLTLTGSVRSDDGSKMKIGGATGSLVIGSDTYTLSDGQGEANKHGSIEIQSKTNGGNHKLELVLHGNIGSNGVTFTLPESKLSSLYFLFLSGQITVNLNSPSNSSSNSNTNQLLELGDELRRRHSSSAVLSDRRSRSSSASCRCS